MSLRVGTPSSLRPHAARGWRRRRVGELVLGLLSTAELVGWFLGACRRWAARRAAGSVAAWSSRGTEERGELFGTRYRIPRLKVDVTRG